MNRPDAQPRCPKCGHDEYRTRYQRPATGTDKLWLEKAGLSANERMRYRCQRCHYEWRGDCLNAKVEAENSGPIQPQQEANDGGDMGGSDR